VGQFEFAAMLILLDFLEYPKLIGSLSEQSSCLSTVLGFVLIRLSFWFYGERFHCTPTTL